MIMKMCTIINYQTIIVNERRRTLVSQIFSRYFLVNVLDKTLDGITNKEYKKSLRYVITTEAKSHGLDKIIVFN